MINHKYFILLIINKLKLKKKYKMKLFELRQQCTNFKINFN